MRHPLAVAFTLVLLIAAGAAVAGEPAGRTPQPVIERATAGTQCVAAPDVMRRDHPSLLKHQRDETVHRGVREARASLKACIGCHASAATGSVAQAKTDFCSSCHSLRSGADRLLRVPLQQGAAHHGAGHGGQAMKTGADQGLSGRRKFLGLAAAGMGGVLLAPGIHLIEIAQAATPGASSTGALGPADRHDQVRQRLHRLRQRLQHRERARPAPLADLGAVDPQGRDQGDQDRAHVLACR